MGTTDNRQRYYFVDNLRWVIVVLVLIYHVFYNFNAQGVFGGIGGFAEQQWQDVVGTILYPWFMTLMFLLAGMSSRYALQHRTAREFRRERTRKLLVPSTLGVGLRQHEGRRWSAARGGARRGEVPHRRDKRNGSLVVYPRPLCVLAIAACGAQGA